MPTLTKAQFDLLAHAIRSGGSFALRDGGPRAFGHVTGGRSAIAVLIRKGFFTRSNGSKGVPPVLTITPTGIDAHKAEEKGNGRAVNLIVEELVEK